jgi:hypothetical protein
MWRTRYNLLTIVLLNNNMCCKIEDETESHDRPEDEIEYNKVHEISCVGCLKKLKEG